MGITYRAVGVIRFETKRPQDIELEIKTETSIRCVGDFAVRAMALWIITAG